MKNNNSEYSNFGRKVEELRISKGYKSQAALYKDLPVDRKTYEKWLKQERPSISGPNLYLLCEKLGCSMDYLYGKLDTDLHDDEWIHENFLLDFKTIEELRRLTKESGKDEYLIKNHFDQIELINYLLSAEGQDIDGDTFTLASFTLYTIEVLCTWNSGTETDPEHRAEAEWHEHVALNDLKNFFINLVNEYVNIKRQKRQ